MKCSALSRWTRAVTCSAGGCRGLYIFNVPTIEEAEKLVVLDPAVSAGAFVPELTLWYGSAAMMVVPETHKKLEKPKP